MSHRKPGGRPLFDAYIGFEHVATYQSLGKALAAIQRRAGKQDVRAGNVVVKRRSVAGSSSPRRLRLIHRTNRTPLLVVDRPLQPRPMLGGMYPLGFVDAWHKSRELRP
jgi:hypothetical protein